MSHPFSHLQPITYDYTLDIRFADLDSYGHLNSTRYLDLVNTARLLFMEREMGLRLSELVEKNVGFYMSKAMQEFLRPVKGLQQVRVTSHIENVISSKVVIEYEISNPEKDRVFSKGSLEYFVVDLITQKSTEMPLWMGPYFFK